MIQSDLLWWLGQHLLMTTTLAVIVYAVCRLIRPGPAARHVMWLLVLCRMMIPSIGFWPWPITVQPPGETERQPPVVDAGPVATDVVAVRIPALDVNSPANAGRDQVIRSGQPATAGSTAPVAPAIRDTGFSLPWGSIVAGLWLAGSLTVLLLLIARLQRVTRMLAGDSDSMEWLRRDIAGWSRQLRVRPPACVVSNRFLAPFLWCLGRVRLVWPESLAQPDQRESARPVIVHELAHLKRRDHWTAWIELFALAVWWWNPVFWLVRRQLRTASEMACDAWVVRMLPDERRTYAETLLEFSTRVPRLRFAIGAVGASSGSRRTFQRRLEMIMNDQISTQIPKWMMATVILLGLISLPAFSTDQASGDPGGANANETIAPVDAASDSAPDDETFAPAVTASDAAFDPLPGTDNTPPPGPAADPIPFTGVEELLERIEDSYYGTVDRGQLERAAIEAILSRLDGESQLLSREQLQEMTVVVDGELVGVGISLQIDSDLELPVVTRPILRSPAQAAGIRPRDVILAIDGESTEEMELMEIVDRIRGPGGTTVALSIRRGEETLDVDVTRAQFAPSQVEPWSVSMTGEENHWIDEQQGIGYIRVPGFTRQTGPQFRAALTDLEENALQGLVLDLRDCPGGLLTAATEVADLFIDEGIIVSSRGRDAGNDLTIHATADGTRRNLRVAVLVNGMTASAAEILAACLQDHHRAAIVGEQTYGRGIVQSLFPLNGGGALKLTTATWLRPNGRTLHRREGNDDWGVQPDPGLDVSITDADRRRLRVLAEQRLSGEEVDPHDDAQLKTAIDWLLPLPQRALNITR